MSKPKPQTKQERKSESKSPPSVYKALRSGSPTEKSKEGGNDLADLENKSKKKKFMSAMEQSEQDAIKRKAAFYNVTDEVSELFNLLLNYFL